MAQNSSQSAAEPVVITVTVTNKRGEFVTGLEQSYFSVFEDKTRQPIAYFSDIDEPTSIGILFDASGSMDVYGSRKFRILRDALARFLELSNRSNEYFVIGFNYRPQLLSDWSPDPKAVIDKLSALRPKGNTAFYDACYLGVEKVMHGRYSKRAIILISDGQDNESHYTINDLRRLLKESNVAIYTANLFPSAADAGSSLGMEGQTILGELSKISGGTAFSQQLGVRLDVKQIYAVFELIAEELRRQYSIGFVPAEGTPNKWHRIRVEVTPPGKAPRETRSLSVRSREGYYVP